MSETRANTRTCEHKLHSGGRCGAAAPFFADRFGWCCHDHWNILTAEDGRREHEVESWHEALKKRKANVAGRRSGKR